jgi:hypothetical protein
MGRKPNSCKLDGEARNIDAYINHKKLKRIGNISSSRNQAGEHNNRERNALDTWRG